MAWNARERRVVQVVEMSRLGNQQKRSETGLFSFTRMKSQVQSLLRPPVRATGLG
jgi:hypothetical protein